jgi:hypothetical protein
MKNIDPNIEKCIIVFKGTPEILYAYEGNSETALGQAQELATSLAENPGDKATYMVVPREYVEQLSLVVVNKGVVLRTLQEVLDDE